MTLIAAADGSALGNPGPAGWAWYINEKQWRSGGWKSATNNQGELMAVFSLLQETRELNNQPMKIICDSQYVINSLTVWIHNWKKNNWRKSNGKKVLNDKLIKLIDAELADRNVTFEWVKGHTGHPLNEKADDLAKAAAEAYARNLTPERGPGFNLRSSTNQFSITKNTEDTLF